MSMENLPVVIVGAGHAGGRCAERLRHFGWQGGIVLIGDEPHPPYERPPLSKTILVKEEEPVPSFILDEVALAELDIEHRAGTVCQSIDTARRKVRLGDGTEIGYGKLVLATGLVPRRLPLLDVLGPKVFYLHKFEDARALRAVLKPGRRLLVIGAGFVGLEVAASARTLGAEVTVVEMAPRPLGRVLPESLSSVIATSHRDAGTRILCGRKIAEVTQASDTVTVTLDDGEAICADIIVVGIGGIPNDAIARAAGLLASNGIEVDAHCRTSDPDIYSIGDVALHGNAFYRRCWRLESWMNAEEMAANAARSICDEQPFEATIPWFWTDQHDRKFQMVGLFGPDDELYEQGLPGEAGYLVYSVNGGRLRGAFGVDAGRAIRKAQQSIRAGNPVSREDLLRAGFTPQEEAVET